MLVPSVRQELPRRNQVQLATLKKDNARHFPILTQDYYFYHSFLKIDTRLHLGSIPKILPTIPDLIRLRLLDSRQT